MDLAEILCPSEVLIGLSLEPVSLLTRYSRTIQLGWQSRDLSRFSLSKKVLLLPQCLLLGLQAHRKHTYSEPWLLMLT